MTSTTAPASEGGELHFEELDELRTPQAVEGFVQARDLEWKRVGEQHNTGTAEMGSDSENALVERETNMIDAIVEREAIEQYGDLESAKSELPADPREAVSELLELPVEGYDGVNQREVSALAERAVVKVLDGSDNDDRLTVDLRDQGVGQHPSDFGSTLLSLHGDNKNTIPFLIGNFGQGGSNSYALSEYTIVVSRSHEGGEVGWTVVRMNGQHETEDGGTVRAYEYAVEPDGSIPRLSIEDAPEFEAGGTLIRLVDLYAPEFTGRADDKLKLSNVAGVTKKGLFASIYPIRVEDHRRDGNPHATIKGGRHLLDGSQYVDKVGGERTRGVIDVPTPHGDVEVRWWVIDPEQSEQDDTKRAIVGRFADPTYPVVWTRSGQVHNEGRKRDLFDNRSAVDLGFLKDRIVLEVNADTLPSNVQESIFSSTRDRVLETEEYDDVFDAIAGGLGADPELDRLNEHYHQRALDGSESAEQANDDLSDLMSQFDVEANDLPGTDVPSGSGPAEGEGRGGSPGGGGYEPDPVDNLKPEPTWLEVANDGNPVTVRQGGTFTLHLRTDAEDRFEDHDPEFETIVSRGVGGALQRQGRRELKSGHTYVTFDIDGASVGDDGSVTAELHWSDGELEAQVEVEVVEPIESGDDGGAGGSVSPKIIAQEDAEDAPFNFGSESVVKYVENQNSQDEVHIALFNENIEPILEEVDQSGRTLNRYTREYMAHIAFKTAMEHHSDVEWSNEELRNRTRNQTAVALMQAIAKNVDPSELG